MVSTLLSGDHCVTELADLIGLSQSCTTRHLQVLKREGIVEGSRSGKRVVFRLCVDEPWITSLIAWALSAPRPVDALDEDAFAAASVAAATGSGRARRPLRGDGPPGSGADPVVVGALAVEPSNDSPRLEVADSGTVPDPRKSPDLEDFLL